MLHQCNPYRNNYKNKKMQERGLYLTDIAFTVYVADPSVSTWCLLIFYVMEVLWKQKGGRRKIQINLAGFFQHSTTLLNAVHWLSQSPRSELGTVDYRVLKYAEMKETRSTDPWFYTSLSQSEVKLEKFSDKSCGSESLFALLLA